MLTKELILGILHGQKFTAKVYGSPADIISAEDFDTVAEEILLIAQPNSEPPPQLQQTPCSTLRELLTQMQSKEQGLGKQAAERNEKFVEEDHWLNEAAIIRILAVIDAQKPVA